MRRREGSFVLFSLSSLRSFVHRLDGMKLVFFSLSQVFEVTSGDRILLESLAAILTLFYLLFPSTSSYWLGKRTTDWQIGCGPRLGAMRFIIGHLLLCDYRSAFMKKRNEEKKTLAGRGWYTVGKSINQNFCLGVRSPLPFMCVMITGEKSRKIST